MLKITEVFMPLEKSRYKVILLSQTHSFFQSKDQLVFIPLSHLITLEMAKSVGVGKKLVDAGVDLLSPKHSFLSTFLLRERKNPESFWRPYLDMLPKDYNSFPVFFSDQEMKLLEGSPFAGNFNFLRRRFLTF